MKSIELLVYILVSFFLGGLLTLGVTLGIQRFLQSREEKAEMVSQKARTKALEERILNMISDAETRERAREQIVAHARWMVDQIGFGLLSVTLSRAWFYSKDDVYPIVIPKVHIELTKCLQKWGDDGTKLVIFEKITDSGLLNYSLNTLMVDSEDDVHRCAFYAGGRIIEAVFCRLRKDKNASIICYWRFEE